MVHKVRLTTKNVELQIFIMMVFDCRTYKFYSSNKTRTVIWMCVLFISQTKQLILKIFILRSKINTTCWSKSIVINVKIKETAGVERCKFVLKSSIFGNTFFRSNSRTIYKGWSNSKVTKVIKYCNSWYRYMQIFDEYALFLALLFYF